CTTEEVGIELFKPRAGDGGVEVSALVKRVNLNACLRTGGQGPLGPLAGCPQASDCSLVVGDILLILALKLPNEVVDHAIVKVLPTQARLQSTCNSE
ncbi:hypothetical protein Z043_121386, partial [Scleropages formosus]